MNRTNETVVRLEDGWHSAVASRGSPPGYFYGEDAPPYKCPHGLRRIKTLEDCLIAFRDGNLHPKGKTKCFRCPEGLKNRSEFSGEPQAFEQLNRRYRWKDLSGQEEPAP